MPEVKRRERLPVSYLSTEETRLLASRHAAIKNKAKVRGVEFPWPKFSDYLRMILELAPSDYLPSNYRISHGSGYDFSPSSLRFKRKGSDPSEASTEAELVSLLFTTEGDLDQLVREAEIAALSA
jgi:hypothetical protein